MRALRSGPPPTTSAPTSRPGIPGRRPSRRPTSSTGWSPTTSPSSARRDYSLVPGRAAHLTTASGSASACSDCRSRDGPPAHHPPAPPRQSARTPRPLHHQGELAPTVHRAVYLDYIGIRRFDGDGAVIGEHRFLGLFTASAYADSVLRIPYVRTRSPTSWRPPGFPRIALGQGPARHPRELPRDEVFQASTAQLLDVASQVVHPAESAAAGCSAGSMTSAGSSRPRLHPARSLQHRRPPPHGGDPRRGVWRHECRLHHARLGVRPRAGPLRSPAPREVPPPRGRRGGPREQDRRCDPHLGRGSRRRRHPRTRRRGDRLGGRLWPGVSTSYKEDFSVKQGIADIRHLDALGDADATALVLYKPRWNPETIRRFKLFRQSSSVADPGPAAVHPHGRRGR